MPANLLDAVFQTRNVTWQQVNNVERRWRQIRREAGLEWITPEHFRRLRVAPDVWNDRDDERVRATRTAGNLRLVIFRRQLRRAASPPRLRPAAQAGPRRVNWPKRPLQEAAGVGSTLRSRSM